MAITEAERQVYRKQNMDKKVLEYLSETIGEDFVFVQKIGMLYPGWECDQYAWIVESAKDGEIVRTTRNQRTGISEEIVVLSFKKGQRLFAHTNHGYPYVTDSPKELQEQIEQQLEALDEQQKALAELNA